MKRIFTLALALAMLLSMLAACGKDDSSIGVIGGADGPTEIIVGDSTTPDNKEDANVDQQPAAPGEEGDANVDEQPAAPGEEGDTSAEQQPAEPPVSSKPEENTPSTEPEATPDESAPAAGAAVSNEDMMAIIDKIYEKVPVEFMVGSMEVDIADADALKMFTGLADASKLNGAVVSEAMIGSIAYSMVLVNVKDAADAKSVAEQMRDGIDQRKWICVTADDLSVVANDTVVMLVMIGSDHGIASSLFVDAFSAVRGGLTVDLR